MASDLLQVRRLAGQSIRDQKERLTDSWLVPICFFVASSWVLWGVEQFKAATHQPPQPTAMLCFAIAATGVAIIGLRRLFPRFQNLNRGERGEIKVAEALDNLRAAGYRIIHDITGDNYNIDHVIVGPAGVFAIETKFRSGRGEISFRNGEGLFIGDFLEEKDVLKQARSNAAEVNRIIQETCGIYQWVKPLVVFVGDWKVRNDWATTDARVFSANTIADYIIDQQPELTRNEIKLIASHLERSARS